MAELAADLKRREVRAAADARGQGLSVWQIGAPAEGIPRRLQRLGRRARAAVGDVRGALRVFERTIRRAIKGKREKPGDRPERLSPFDAGDYARWIARNDTLSGLDRALIRGHIASFRQKPKVSIVMTIDRADAAHLGEAVASVRGQLYEDWELCIVGDAAVAAAMRTTLEQLAGEDARIRPVFGQANSSVAACRNAALATASGDWIVPMGHDDMLSEHALYLVAAAIESDSDLAIVYSDEDRIDKGGLRSLPFFKPDWDPDLFLGQNLIGQLGACRSDLVRRSGGLREDFEGAEDRDLALRMLDSTPGAKVHHIPFVLYHRRRTDDALHPTAPSGAAAAAQRAVNEHFTRTGEDAAAIPTGHLDHLRIRRGLPAERPLVSIVIPTKNQCALLRTCFDGLLNRTGYAPIEIVVVDNGSDADDARAFLADIRRRPNVKVVEDARRFNFSRLVNLGVAASSGEICVLLNNDVDVINTDWLDELVSHVIRPEVGAVGAMLYYADDTVQHGGVILGINGVAGHEHKHAPRGSHGYFGRLGLAHQLSCVTGACIAIRREVYDALGGFNERDLTVGLNDVDFCVRLRLAGYRIIWTPHAELYHYESISRGRATATAEGSARHAAEVAYVRRQWGPVLDGDPYYNPNFTLDSLAFGLDAATRVRKPWLDFAAARSRGGCGAPNEDAAGALRWSQ